MRPSQGIYLLEHTRMRKPNPRLEAQIALDVAGRKWKQAHPERAEEEFFPIDMEWVLRNCLSHAWTAEFRDVDSLDPSHPIKEREAFTDFVTRTIIVARASNQQRRRLTLAHELGHVLMHEAIVRERGGPPPYRSTERDALEREAWTFAREFLLPEDPVRGVVRNALGLDTIWIRSAVAFIGKTELELDSVMRRGDTRHDVVCRELAGFRSPERGAMCDHFGVSKYPMGYRLAELGVVTV